MSRPFVERRITSAFPVRMFKPAGVPGRELETLAVTLDELEALRLVDGDGLVQDVAARRMGVSRPTLGRILNEARRKTATALTRGWALVIENGPPVVRSGGPPMIVAVPTENSQVVSHWGHASQISLYKIPSESSGPFHVVTADEGCACKSGLAGKLAEQQVTHVLVGQLGQGAFNALARFGMTVIRGVSGSAEDAIARFASGALADSGGLCAHSGDHAH